jgi:hypothetical protein
MHAIRKLRESGHATAADYEAILAANVVFHSPVLIRAVEGRAAVAKIFAASTTLREGAYTGEWKLDDRRTLLRWSGKFRVMSWRVLTSSKKTRRGSSSIAQWLFVQCLQRNFFGTPCGLLSEALFQTISGNIQIRTSVDRRCRSLRCRSVGRPHEGWVSCDSLSRCRNWQAECSEGPRWYQRVGSSNPAKVSWGGFTQAR